MEKYKFKWSPLILLTFIVQNLLTKKLRKKNSWYEFKPFKTQWLPLFFEYPGQNLLTKNLLRIIIKKNCDMVFRDCLRKHQENI